MNGEDKKYVTYPILWGVAAAIMTAGAISMSTLFDWHKETPHAGTVTSDVMDRIERQIDTRFDRLEAQLTRLEGSG